jgi:hypothetical protein
LQKIIYLVNYILFLHICVKNKCQVSLTDLKDKENEMNSIILANIKKRFTQNFLEKFKEQRIFQLLSELSIQLSMKFDNNLESIFNFLSRNINLEKSTLSDNLEDQILNEIKMLQNKIFEIKEEVNIKADLFTINKEFEELSYQDYISNKAKSFSNRKYNKFYFDKFTIGGGLKFVSKKEISQKDEFINCEEILVKGVLNEDYFDNNKLKFYGNFEKVIKSTIKEDKYFYKTLLINKVQDITNRNLYETNYLLYVIKILI